MATPFLVLAVLLAVYLVASPRIGEPFYRGELFQPYKYPTGNYDQNTLEGVKAQDVFFNAGNGNKLHAWYFQTPGASRTILVCHGNTGNLGDLQVLLRLLVRTGCSVFAFDYQGYGKSEGSPTVKGICDDAMAAYDYLADQGKTSPQDIVVYGESLGAAVACQVASQRSCAGIVLQSPFSSLRQIAVENIPVLTIYPTWLFPKPYLDTMSILKKPHSPLLILHGQKDPEVPIRHSEALFAQAHSPKAFVRLPHTLHEDIAEPDWDLFVSTIKSFLAALG